MFLRTETMVSTKTGHGATLLTIYSPSFEEPILKSDTVEVSVSSSLNVMPMEGYTF